jgi:hypothetical protein
MLTVSICHLLLRRDEPNVISNGVQHATPIHKMYCTRSDSEVDDFGTLGPRIAVGAETLLSHPQV